MSFDEALEQFAKEFPSHAKVVRLRHFGGCTIEETADALGVCAGTVKRHWQFARAWLESKLDG